MGNGILSSGTGPCTTCKSYKGWWRWGTGRTGVDCAEGCSPPNREGCHRWRAGGDRCAGIRVIVSGGRDFGDKERIYAALDRLHGRTPVGVVIEGGSSGAEKFAWAWAAERGVAYEEWAPLHEHGDSAEALRNQELVDAGANGVVAFPGGRCTRDLATRAELAGIKVWRPYA